MYKDIIKEISFEELKQKCKNGEINIDSPISKVWAINYLGDKAENQADYLLNVLVDNEIIFMVEINPSILFDTIYSIKCNNDSFDIVAIFKDNIVNENKLFEMYAETANEFTIQCFINDQEKLNSIEKEEYDPLGFKESQQKIDTIRQQYKDGEISLGEMLEELGFNIDYDKQQVIDIAEKLIKKELKFEQLQEMYNNKELTDIDLIDISSIIDNEFPELHGEFNKLLK